MLYGETIAVCLRSTQNT